MNPSELFLVFIKVGLFSFGGGYAVVPLIAAEVVYQQQWLTASQFANLIAISQLTPGPIIVNTATLVGWRLEGVLGAFLATFAVILPGTALMLGFTHYYERFQGSSLFRRLTEGFYPVVVALLAAAAVFVGKTVAFNWKILMIVFISWLCLTKKWLSPVWVLLGAAFLGWLLSVV